MMYISGPKHQTHGTQRNLSQNGKFGQSDGGPSMSPGQEPQDMLGGSKFSSNVKEKVQALLTQLPLLPGYSSMRKPGFVYLLEGDPEGIISCTPHPLEA